MACDAGASAIADEDDLIAAVMGLMRRAADPFATVFERHRLGGAVGHLGIAQQPFERGEIAIQPLPHHHVSPSIYLSRPVMPLISDALSIERRWPTISTLSAPTTLPMKPTWCISPPAATSGAVTVRKASPAPTVSTTFLAKAGMVWAMPPRS